MALRETLLLKLNCLPWPRPASGCGGRGMMQPPSGASKSISPSLSPSSSGMTLQPVVQQDAPIKDNPKRKAHRAKGTDGNKANTTPTSFTVELSSIRCVCTLCWRLHVAAQLRTQARSMPADTCALAHTLNTYAHTHHHHHHQQHGHRDRRHTHTHTCINTDMHLCMHARMYAQTCTCMPAHIHAFAHSRHTHMRARKHTHGRLWYTCTLTLSTHMLCRPSQTHACAHAHRYNSMPRQAQDDHQAGLRIRACTSGCKHANTCLDPCIHGRCIRTCAHINKSTHTHIHTHAYINT